MGSSSGTAVLSQRWLPGVYPGGQEGEQREMLQVQLEQQEACYPAKEVKIPPQPSSLFPTSSCGAQAALQEADDCPGLQLQNSLCWCSWVTTAPGIAVGTLAALPTSAPAASARHTRCFKKCQQPCTSASGVRRQNGISGVLV